MLAARTLIGCRFIGSFSLPFTKKQSARENTDELVVRLCRDKLGVDLTVDALCRTHREFKTRNKKDVPGRSYKIPWADYWKSQAKKFCDFCKCWIADNKPSVGFHESGKRHKENVAKRLSEISKNSLESHNESVQVDLEMKKMEEEAFKAYMKDLQENPDYTSKKILEETEKRKKELEESLREQKEGEKEDSPNPKEATPEPEAETSKSTKVWHEAKSDEGYTYYWNINTSESIWEPPEVGFVSLEEQEKEAKLKEEIKRRKKEEKAKKKEEELKNSQEQESTKKKKRKKGKGDGEEEPSCVMGPAPRANPYGEWSVIEPKVEEPLDLELPQQDFIAIKVPELKEPEIKFKEKTIATLEKDETKYHGFVKKEPAEFSENFKKRKLNRGNVRQKLDTD